MIPKIIHYIWLGKGETPKVFDKCLASWKKYCPDWEIKRWDESNLNIDLCPYIREAYDARKFAFASDVLRLDLLNRFGGVYLDIDVELLKPIDEFLDEYAFTGFETNRLINPGLIFGSVKDNKDLVQILEEYSKRHFVVDGRYDFTTICETCTAYYEKLGLKKKNKTQRLSNLVAFSNEFFCPYNYKTKKIKATPNTHSIHWYNASWVERKGFFARIIEKIYRLLLKILKFLIGKKQYEKLKTKIHKK